MTVVNDRSDPGVTEGRYPAPDAAHLLACTRAIESLMKDRGVIDDDTIDVVAAKYENDIGPFLGAKVVARAWSDPDFFDRLLSDATAACKELGIGGMQGEHLIALADTDDVHHVIVCTLCSCYPWPVLGIPPTWYKSPEYRSRIVSEPRELLRDEFGYDVRADVEIRVVDTSAEMRYFVVPQRPAGTDNLSEDELANLVTRDSIIGVGPVAAT